jgi:hypothetical protein
VEGELAVLRTGWQVAITTRGGGHAVDETQRRARRVFIQGRPARLSMDLVELAGIEPATS